MDQRRASRERNPETSAAQQKAAEQQWKRNNPDKVAVHERRRKLKKKYGITLEEFESMAEAQGGLCAICGRSPASVLVVDHCHTTSVVRGLLCVSCNRGLGDFHDDPDRLRRAAEYLERIR